ncbi:CGNR zinc finger domain-containing protein [Mycolicibacterium sp. P1-18]|uniref:CGNR zinc finger domain-containing protein n=1 Tax=Mycolicibacterium sp. P1-18 TaxID=2024615 RepID=UPI0011F3B345|nr:CGNR zinc finger domain-containing protein [Mycolicibacterium sp. P1-18]KAA0093248.1 CGNR zinc finger domain-containing protein [Mycolicibacterium sp. P1-18]
MIVAEVGVDRWAAVARHGNRPAPGGLALVHDFLETRSVGTRHPDLLGTAARAQTWGTAAAQAWSAGRHRAVPPTTLTEHDAARLRELRTHLVDVLAGVPTAVALHAMPHPTMTLGGDDDGLRWLPTGEGWRWFLGAILGEVALSQQAGTWQRMKQCRNSACGATFYDSSWRNADVWHNARTCAPAAEANRIQLC